LGLPGLLEGLLLLSLLLLLLLLLLLKLTTLVDLSHEHPAKLGNLLLGLLLLR
jgi:hypothetical protein